MDDKMDEVDSKVDNDMDDKVHDDVDDKANNKASNELNNNLEDNVETYLENDVVYSDKDKDDMDNFIEASRCKPKAKEDICRWTELRDKLQADLEAAYKGGKPLMHINKLLVLQNFAIL
jgi:hypothetical protein